MLSLLATLSLPQRKRASNLLCSKIHSKSLWVRLSVSFPAEWRCHAAAICIRPLYLLKASPILRSRLDLTSHTSSDRPFGPVIPTYVFLTFASWLIVMVMVMVTRRSCRDSLLLRRGLSERTWPDSRRVLVFVDRSSVGG